MSKYKEQYEKETGQFWRFRPGTRLHDIRVSRAYSYWLEKRLEEAEGKLAELLKYDPAYCNAILKGDLREDPGTETPDPEKE